MTIRKRLALKFQTEWAVHHPSIANTLDSILFMRRETPVYTDIPTMLTPSEREYLFQLSKANSQPSVILEIGCYAGGSAYFLGRGAELSDSFVYSVDPFDSDLERQAKESDGSDYHNKLSKKEVQDTMRRHGLENRVILVEGFSTEVALAWDKPIETLFIDGNHKQAYNDYVAWRIYLANNAVIVFHDGNFPKYGRRDVSEAIERIVSEEGLTIIRRVVSLVALRRLR